MRWRVGTIPPAGCGKVFGLCSTSRTGTRWGDGRREALKTPVLSGNHCFFTIDNLMMNRIDPQLDKIHRPEDSVGHVSKQEPECN